MTTQWPHKHQHLYDVPVAILGLSDKAMRALEDEGLTVGDCVLFFIRTFTLHPSSKTLDPELINRLRGTAQSEDYIRFHRYMFVEVEQKLKEHGYWSFVESGLSENDKKS